jgi:hypothetical protein
MLRGRNQTLVTVDQLRREASVGIRLAGALVQSHAVLSVRWGGRFEAGAHLGRSGRWHLPRSRIRKCLAHFVGLPVGFALGFTMEFAMGFTLVDRLAMDRSARASLAARAMIPMSRDFSRRDRFDEARAKRSSVASEMIDQCGMMTMGRRLAANAIGATA